jgi:hypothetical protein
VPDILHPTPGSKTLASSPVAVAATARIHEKQPNKQSEDEVVIRLSSVEIFNNLTAFMLK